MDLQAVQTGVTAFLANPTAQLWRDWITSTGMLTVTVSGVVYVIRAAAEMKQWTKDHAGEDDRRFDGVEQLAKERFDKAERRMDGLHNALSAFDEKMGAWYDGLMGVLQERLSSFELRIERTAERLDRLVDGKGGV